MVMVMVMGVAMADSERVWTADVCLLVVRRRLRVLHSVTGPTSTQLRLPLLAYLPCPLALVMAKRLRICKSVLGLCQNVPVAVAPAHAPLSSCPLNL